MTTVEKGSPLHSGQLVSMGEAIINSERGSWLSSTSSAKDDDEKKKKTTEDSKKA